MTQQPQQVTKPFVKSNKLRYTYYINESQYVVILFQHLLNNHLVLFNSNLPIALRSIPNTINKAIVGLLLQYLQTHNHLSKLKLKDFVNTVHQITQLDSQNKNSDSDDQEINISQKDDESLKCEQSGSPQNPTTPQEEEQQQEASLQPYVCSAPIPKTSQFYCQVCSLDFISVIKYREHMRTPEHAQQLRRNKVSGPAAPISSLQQVQQQQHMAFNVTSPFETPQPQPQVDMQHSKPAQVVEKVVILTEEHHDDGIIDYHYCQDDNNSENRLTKKQKKQQHQHQTQHKSCTAVTPTASLPPHNDHLQHSDIHQDSQFLPHLTTQTQNIDQDNLSNKTGSVIQLLLVPIVSPCDNVNQESQTSSSKPKNCPTNVTMVNNNNTEQLLIFLTKQHVIQNLVIVNNNPAHPHGGALFIPSSTISLNNLSAALTPITTSDHAITNHDDPRNIYLQFMKSMLYMLFSSLTSISCLLPTTQPALTAIIMDSGGKFALTIFHSHSVVYHTSVSNYTTRKKQGKQQAVHDKEGGRAKSVGSSIRRQQTIRHKERIREVLYHLRAELFACNQILLYIPSPLMREQFFMSKEQLVKWSNTGGQFIGHTDTPTPANIDKATTTKSNVNYTFFTPLNEKMGTNITTDAIPNNNSGNNINNMNLPITQPLTIPNMNYYIREKYAKMFDNGYQYNCNKERPSVFQLTYVNKKKGSKQKNNREDVEQHDEELINHNITEDWHKDTLIFHMQSTVSNSNNKQQKQRKNKEDNSMGYFEHTISVDQFVNTASTQLVRSEMFSLAPMDAPQFSSSMYIPTTTDSLNKISNEASHRTHTDYNSLTTNTEEQYSFLQHTLRSSASTTGSSLSVREDVDGLHSQNASVNTNVPNSIFNYIIKPYHPHFFFCNNTPPNEHLFLLNPNDPRIVNIGMNIHDAKHHEIVRFYSHLMRLKQQTLAQNQQDPQNQQKNHPSSDSDDVDWDISDDYSDRLDDEDDEDEE